jgi:hypothetical protein
MENLKDELNKTQAEHKPKGFWLNLVLFVFVLYNLFFAGTLFLSRGFSWNVDFRGYYSAGQIMNERRVVDIYDLDVLSAYQDELRSPSLDPDENQEVAGMLYLPVFLVPFRLFALFDMPVGMLLWDGLNVVLLILYLVHFSKQVSGKTLPLQTLVLMLISFPVFRNFLDGQVNVWMLICFGEFLLAITTDKPLKSGLWLGGLLIKPHFLMLVLLFLLIQKKFKAIGGFALSTLAIAGLSFILIGWEGLLSLTDVIQEAALGGVSSFGEVMMNWRALGFYVGLLTTPAIGEIFSTSLSLVTGLLPLAIFRRRMDADAPVFVIALLGVLAATTAAVYHAHIHTAMILIPALLYLYLKGYLDKKLLVTWVLIPEVGFFLQFIVVAVTSLFDLSFLPSNLVTFVYGQSMMVANLILLAWSVKKGLEWQRDRLVEAQM